MINFLLKFPSIYRFYQKIIRKRHDEYNFIKLIISEIANSKDIRMLDLCSGDSYILEDADRYIKSYLGIDNNRFYLKKCKKKWNRHNFLNLDLNNFDNFKIYKKFKPNFIFMMGALHHFDDYTVTKITSCIKKYFPKSIFLSVDPVIYNNNFLNRVMIYFDRGKFIRNKNQYNNIIKNYNFHITNDFYTMSFKYIFHYRNLNFKKYYTKWKKNVFENN